MVPPLLENQKVMTEIIKPEKNMISMNLIEIFSAIEHVKPTSTKNVMIEITSDFLFICISPSKKAELSFNYINIYIHLLVKVSNTKKEYLPQNSEMTILFAFQLVR
jgi:hypothetical protein